MRLMRIRRIQRNKQKRREVSEAALEAAGREEASLYASLEGEGRPLSLEGPLPLEAAWPLEAICPSEGSLALREGRVFAVWRSFRIWKQDRRGIGRFRSRSFGIASGPGFIFGAGLALFSYFASFRLGIASFRLGIASAGREEGGESFESSFAGVDSSDAGASARFSNARDSLDSSEAGSFETATPSPATGKEGPAEDEASKGREASDRSELSGPAEGVWPETEAAAKPLPEASPQETKKAAKRAMEAAKRRQRKAFLRFMKTAPGFGLQRARVTRRRKGSLPEKVRKRNEKSEERKKEASKEGSLGMPLLQKRDFALASLKRAAALGRASGGCFENLEQNEAKPFSPF
jgi:hypothetical protein